MSEPGRVNKEILQTSQDVGVTKLSEQQYQDELVRAKKNFKIKDEILSYEHDLVQKRLNNMRADLPHLYGLKFYVWARKFFECRNRMNLLCAANQIGKSSIQIRKFIEWAGNKSLWDKLWTMPPSQFWYFYPSQETIDTEFTKKWVPEFLPRGAMKVDKDYGWEPVMVNGSIGGVAFKSGVTIYFKTYGQRILNLQTSTVHMIGCDEEMPEEFVDELMARLRFTSGYFSQVFTATRGLPLWYRAMECIGTEDEAFPKAFKQVVSMWDCQLYEDGTPSPWTPQRIAEEEALCTSKKEVLKRIYGRFVKDEGLRYETFNPERNVQTGELPPPDDWKYYAGIDIGSGGKIASGAARSSAAVVIVAVNPENTRGRVVRTWRGDNEETTAGDILKKYLEVKGNLKITLAVYDYASREFGLLSSRLSAGIIPADKTRSSGEQTLNLLFKTASLQIDGGVYHNQKLVTELMSIPGGEKKNRRFQDDLADALRYVIAAIPWDISKISPEAVGIIKSGVNKVAKEDIPDARWTKEEYLAWEIRQRRGEFDTQDQGDWQNFEEEISAWNEAYGS
jgi:phage terminase large subunit-like protein